MYLKIALSELIAFCQKNYDSNLTQEKLRALVIPVELVFKRNGKWGFTFDCPWETEMRLAVAFKEDMATAGIDDILI